MRTEEIIDHRSPRSWKARLIQTEVGAGLGAVHGGPAGVIGGAVLGAWAEVCTWDLIDGPTTLWPWVRAFVLASGGACWVLGAAQEGVSGAVLGAGVGGIMGLIAGLTFGTGICVVGWLVRRIRQRT